MRVRHEDFAMSPVEVTQKIYKFVGKTPTPRLLRWIKWTTERGSGNNPYSVNRLASSVVMKWRKWYTFEQLDLVQQTCQAAMRTLNYTIFHSNEQMRNFQYTSFR